MPVRNFFKDQRIRFIIAGGINTAVGYGAYALFVYIGFHYILATTLSTIIGVINSYFWNKFFTFKSRHRSVTEILRFVSVYIASYLLNIGCLALLVDVWGMNKYIAGGITFLITTLISYFGHRYFSFNPKFEVKRNNKVESSESQNHQQTVRE